MLDSLVNILGMNNQELEAILVVNVVVVIGFVIKLGKKEKILLYLCLW
jgi:hypothetical protein